MIDRSVLIFDVDNTLYDFVDFFGPSFRSMVHALAKTERLPESEIIKSARAVYRQAGTLEHQFLIQSMDIFSSRSPADQERLIRLARVAFSKTRNSRLKLYDGIHQLMTSARANGLKCVCVTNAPYYHVEGRLRDLNVLALIDGLVAWEGSGVDENRDEHVRKYTGRKEQLSKRLQLFCTIGTGQLKPTIYPFSVIVEAFGENYNYVSIGDSISKDLQPASALGMSTIWARYGTVVDQINFKTLLEVTPWSSDEIAMTGELAPPDYIADSPRDISKILGIPVQGELFTSEFLKPN